MSFKLTTLACEFLGFTSRVSGLPDPGREANQARTLASEVHFKYVSYAPDPVTGPRYGFYRTVTCSIVGARGLAGVRLLIWGQLPVRPLPA